jgi:DNA mismatch repair protein MutH
MRTVPPQSEAELIQRANILCGQTFSVLAHQFNEICPDNLLKAKGWMGQLIEKALGADAGNDSEPDFRKISVELKTLPIHRNGKPSGSTYVCTVPLTQPDQSGWENSVVYQKLKRVLWVVIEADPSIPPASRRVGQSLLWSPTADQMAILRQDWEEFMNIIQEGAINEITSHFGQYLQIRPKAAHHRVLTSSIDKSGNLTQTLPRGFYLRPSFTSQVIASILGGTAQDRAHSYEHC